VRKVYLKKKSICLIKKLKAFFDLKVQFLKCNLNQENASFCIFSIVVTFVMLSKVTT
jgi:hypothetical protein